MEALAFLDRVFKKIPRTTSGFVFEHWPYGGRPTDEGVGLLAVPGVDPEKLIRRVMDVDRYVGNVEHVVECRAVKDARFEAPKAVRFFQKVNVPMLAEIQHELVLVDHGELNGFRVAYWYLLETETMALSNKVAARSAYNMGAWMAAPGLVGYALASAPVRDDVGFLKWKALTAGADVAASKVVRANIEGMARWAAKP